MRGAFRLILVAFDRDVCFPCYETWVRRKNEAPYPGRISSIERCNGQSAFGNACNNLASTKKYFSLVATMLQAFPKAFWLSCSFCRNFLAGFIPTSNSRYEGPNEILMGFLRLDRRRTGGAKRLHTITRIRFIPNRSLEHLSIKLYDLGSCGLLKWTDWG